MAEQKRSEAEQFERLSSYPFCSDPEFAVGLSIILGHPEIPASEAEMNRNDDLVLQAKCFYFSRKKNITPPLNLANYKAWLISVPTGHSPVPFAEQSNTSTTMFPPESHTEYIPKSGEEPDYPSSFANIVELITTGQPIPGIQPIPDTVLAGYDTPSTKSNRRKPWEASREGSAH
ncbi:hypothetical protein BO70DRAFT_362701 [Aspergillus heteromorphus CBS 117.55]|uniref:Uncharacterized protein n=1 Tax=Aspergillus heteromorphus CBS 117.55 TaxID=1448321 RepID=A0A317W5V7_9EURO|nr:uncharacterized protein BO70DRAFT_362701 [Aspergillus heteromorphus CBS 117.55]PWY79540.1 hypothetical protein BO70DRAFT_362701 [Aspergillus heteromorphus CBS 117.55]